MVADKVRILCQEDCGNAPKKVLIREFITALTRGDRSFIQDSITNELVWTIAGEEVIRGKEAYLARLAGSPFQADDLTEIAIHNIITHGNVAAANCTIRSPHQQVELCEVYRFSGFKQARIKEITSYVISTPLP